MPERDEIPDEVRERFVVLPIFSAIGKRMCGVTVYDREAMEDEESFLWNADASEEEKNAQMEKAEAICAERNAEIAAAIRSGKSE